ncbi:MAG TPA: hypothetical protein PKA06_14525 [Gemmatales bacterium]|nr:hypothetical protein [Gemmatales bacterium]HMP15834.1 hypothetical protein [Gemmatales bacterium]
MASLRCIVSLLVCSVFGLLGCSSTGRNPLYVFAPYRGSPMGEDLRSPPPNDPRYTQPPSYPPALLKPVAKAKDEEYGTGLRRAPIGSGGMPSPSAMGGPGGF